MDDLKLFCRVDVYSISFLKDTFIMFQDWLSFTINQANNHIYLFGVSNKEKSQIVNTRKFEFGSLPFKYLGVPIIRENQKLGITNLFWINF